MESSENRIRDLVMAFVNETNRDIFITGKAGTGKTTLLHDIRHKITKRVAVAAPTGIAAINADGVTLHSLLKLPTETVLPTMQRGLNRKTTGDVLAGLSFSPDKEKVLKELEVLIIDEVSMLRADLLDVIDKVLSDVRKNPDSFGGVQVIYIGDLFQLPPVVSDDEELDLSRYYKSVFFFDANVVQRSPPVYIELEKVYRQSASQFITLLNHIRENNVSKDDLAILSERMVSAVNPIPDEQIITLTSHKKWAKQINVDALNKLAGEVQLFSASVEGQIEKRKLPFELELELKVGAQVMFVKNDSSADRKYFNGEIGKVVGLSSNLVDVQLANGDRITVEPEKWQNMEYRPINGEIGFEQTATGEVKQLPLRLAWAITIHKSQGLTFDKAIIDAGKSFEAGQIYVALSRVRSLKGVYLTSPIGLENLYSKPSIIAYTSNARTKSKPDLELEDDKRHAVFYFIIAKFRLLDLFQITIKTPAIIEKFRYSANARYIELFGFLQGELNLLYIVGAKFVKEMESTWLDQQDARENGGERIKKAADYYNKIILEKIRPTIVTELSKMLTERAPKELISFYSQLEKLLVLSNTEIQQLPECWIELFEGITLLQLVSRFQRNEDNLPDNARTKKSTATISSVQKNILKLYSENFSITEIATKRNVSAQNIEGHIIELVSFGLISAETILLTEKRMQIQECLIDLNWDIHAVKHKLGASVSFFEIRVALSSQKANSDEKQDPESPTLF